MTSKRHEERMKKEGGRKNESNQPTLREFSAI